MPFQFPTKTWQQFTRRQIARLEEIETAVPSVEFVQLCSDRRALLLSTTVRDVCAHGVRDLVNAMLGFGAHLEGAGLDDGCLIFRWEMPLKRLRPDKGDSA